MEIMYVKYTNGIRHSIIKEGDDCIMNDSKIIPFNKEKKVKINTATTSSISNESSITSICNNKINEEITNFFFDAIHKNYLSIRKNNLKG